MAAVADAAPPFEVSPSIDEVRELARTYNVVPLRTTFIDADCTRSDFRAASLVGADFDPGKGCTRPKGRSGR